MFTPNQKALALDFARALAARDYTRAHAMLGSGARARLSESTLRAHFEAMIPLDWGEVAPIELLSDPMVESVLVYVVLGGPVYSEAIVISSFVDEHGEPKIDECEFGRP